MSNYYRLNILFQMTCVIKSSRMYMNIYILIYEGITFPTTHGSIWIERVESSISKYLTGLFLRIGLLRAS